MYRVQDYGAGMHSQFPPMLLSKLTLTTFKIIHAYSTQSWAVIFLCLTGVVLWPIQVYSFYQLLIDRKELRQHIVKDLRKQKLPIDGGHEKIEQMQSLTKDQKAVHGLWKRFFPDIGNLEKFTRLRDASSKGFWKILGILILLNLSIGGLTHVGVLITDNGHVLLEPPLPHKDHHIGGGVEFARLDLDGDGTLSPKELACLVQGSACPWAVELESRSKFVNELGRLLQRGAAAAAAAEEPLPHWVSYLHTGLPDQDLDNPSEHVRIIPDAEHDDKRQDAASADDIQVLPHIIM
jgi:hypothetical protein